MRRFPSPGKRLGCFLHPILTDPRHSTTSPAYLIRDLDRQARLRMCMRRFHSTGKRLGCSLHPILTDPRHSTTSPLYLIRDLDRQARLRMWMRRFHSTEKRLGCDLHPILTDPGHSTTWPSVSCQNITFYGSLQISNVHWMRIVAQWSMNMLFHFTASVPQNVGSVLRMVIRPMLYKPTKLPLCFSLILLRWICIFAHVKN